MFIGSQLQSSPPSLLQPSWKMSSLPQPALAQVVSSTVPVKSGSSISPMLFSQTLPGMSNMLPASLPSSSIPVTSRSSWPSAAAAGSFQFHTPANSTPVHTVRPITPATSPANFNGIKSPVRSSPQLPTSVPTSVSVGGPSTPKTSQTPSVVQTSTPSMGQTTSSASSWAMNSWSDSYKSSRSTRSSSFCSDPDDPELTNEARTIFKRIAGGVSESITRLKLNKALIEDRTVASFILPGVDATRLMDNDEAYEAANHLFNDLSRGHQSVTFRRFLRHFRYNKSRVSNAAELRSTFDKLDVMKDNRVSWPSFLSVVKSDPDVRDFILHDTAGAQDFSDEEVSYAAAAVYKSIAGDWRHFDFADFVGYCRTSARAIGRDLHISIDRASKKVLIIGPGFGAQLNPAQTQIVMAAGFQIHWIHDIPNPEDDSFNVLPHATKIRDRIAALKPDLVMCGSKGGIYGVAIWQMGYWRGPTVLINAHPSCCELPRDVPIVITHGDQDPVYPRPREELERLIATGSPNMCWLYYSPTSGLLGSGHRPRTGDQHNMATLVQFDLLPRLMESVLCPEGPELHMMRSWLDRVSPARVEAERMLGHTVQQLKKFWVSENVTRNEDAQFLYDVPPGTSEFHYVTTVFRESSKDPSTYGFDKAKWSRCVLTRVQRIENSLQSDGGWDPYCLSLRRSFDCMGIEFVPGVHTRWLFHGSTEVDSIVSNPIQGFQPLAFGSCGETVWGRGTYFARDAGYVASGPFCGHPARDGTRKMLMCLVTTGVSCAGNPQHNGILPMRQHPHRFHSSVDSLSSPEVYVVQHPGAALPAYVVTFLA